MQKARVLFFSPTKTTKRIALSIAEGLNCESVTQSDFSLHHNRESEINVTEDIAIIAVPVYFGRVQEDASHYINNFVKGNNTNAILVAVYGNREYDDALVELFDITSNNGFIPVACGAFIGEHSYATSEYPLAVNRPDQKDTDIAISFGKAIKAKLINNTPNIFDVKGERPYRDYGSFPEQISPPTINSNCCNCGKCISCPKGAIDESDVSKTDKIKCIYCQACLKLCNYNGRENSGMVNDMVKMVYDNNSTRKEPELFL